MSSASAFHLPAISGEDDDQLTTTDRQPPFDPQVVLDTENSSRHEGEIKETILSWSSGDSSEHHLQLPEEKTHFYYLRDRKVDEATKLKRIEHQKIIREKRRLQKERKQSKKRRILREAEEFERVSNEEFEGVSNEEFEQLRNQEFEGVSKEEFERVSKVLTFQELKDYLVARDLYEKNKRQHLSNPNPDDDDFFYDHDDKIEEKERETRIKAEKLIRCEVIKKPPSSPSEGNKKLFTCSGIIYEVVDSTGYAVACATLVKCPDKDEEADELKISALLPSGEKLEGFVSNVDFYYNICVIKFHSPFHVPSKSFSSNTGFADFYKCRYKEVVALGRRSSGALKVSLGNIIPRRSRFDCEELLVSNCKISKRGIGGPLMDFNGNVIGLNFYDKNETPFLPCFIVSRFLRHFKIFGKVIRPWHGLRVRSIHTIQLDVLEKMVQSGLSWFHGVIVDQVEKGSSAEHCRIEEGDIITHVDGLPFSNAAEMGAMLLDRYRECMQDRQRSLSEDPNQMQMQTVFTLKFDVRKAKGGICEKAITTINIDEHNLNGINRWPVPKCLGVPW